MRNNNCNSFMFLVVLFLCIWIPEVRSEDSIPISVTSGVYWREITNAVVYESSVPLAYKSVWPNVDLAHLSLPEHNGFCEQTMNDPQCMLFSWILQADKRVGYQIKWLNSSVMASNVGVKNRVVRSVNFIGKLAHWCCGIVTNRQLKPLFTNQKDMSKFEQELSHQIGEAYEEIEEINFNMKNYSEEVGKTFAQMIDVGINITKLIDRFQKQQFVDEKKNDFKSFSLLQLGAHHVIRQLQTIQLISRLEIMSQCKERKIPSTIVTVESLKTDLISLSSAIQKDGYELVVPADEVTKYLKLEITDCVISGNEVLVNLKIPIRKQNAHWKVYELISVPFAWKNNTCHLQQEQSVLVVNDNKLVVIQGEGLRDCQPNINPLCYAPRYSGDTVSGTLCPRKIFEGATIQELSSVCLLSCFTGNVPLVNKIDEEQFVITHATGPLQLTCRYSNNQTFNLSQHSKLGALEVKVPCDCSLSQSSQMFVSESYPCKKLPAIAEVTHILPAPWSKLKSLKISSFSEKSSNTFNTLDECLDESWPTQIPHWSASISGFQATKPPQLRFAREDHGYYTTMSAAIHVIYVILVTVIVIRNPYLLGLRTMNVVQAETNWLDNNDGGHFMLDCLYSLMMIIVFVLGWQLIIKILVRRRRVQRADVELTGRRDPAKDDGLPRNLPVAAVDGKELRITLEWWEPTTGETPGHQRSRDDEP